MPLIVQLGESDSQPEKPVDAARKDEEARMALRTILESVYPDLRPHPLRRAIGDFFRGLLHKEH